MIDRLYPNYYQYMTSLNFPDNGYKSLVSVTDKLVTVAQARLEMILNKVASVNEVNKFIDFWTRAFRSMSQILGLASGEEASRHTLTSREHELIYRNDLSGAKLEPVPCQA